MGWWHSRRWRSMAVAGVEQLSPRRAGEIDYGIKLDRRGFGIRRPGRHAAGKRALKLIPDDSPVSVDNPYWPMIPGSKWVYRETDTRGTNQKVVVEVTDETKMIANGIEARVIRDTVTEDGAPVEITDDWSPGQGRQHLVHRRGRHQLQERQGRRPRRFVRGGCGRARPRMTPGAEADLDPQGLSYRQEFSRAKPRTGPRSSPSEKDGSRCPSAISACVILMTRDLVPTEPKVQELKFYAPNVGPLFSLHTDGDGSRAELISYSRNG